MKYRYGIIGTGNMGGALARALAKKVPAERMILSNRTPEKAQKLLDSFVYAVENDRYLPGRVRNAYASGDITAFPGWNDAARLPGWYDNKTGEWYEDRYQTGSHVDAGGSDTVTADFIAPASGCGELVLRFQLGNSPADNTVTVSDIQVREVSSGSSEPVTPPEGDKGSFDLQCEANTPAAAELSGDGSSATATVTTPSDDWHIKFYAKPGLSLEAGKSYRVSLDVANAEGCEVCFKNTESGDETGFGAAKVSGGKISHEINAEASAGMEILLKIGAVPARDQGHRQQCQDRGAQRRLQRYHA